MTQGDVQKGVIEFLSQPEAYGVVSPRPEITKENQCLREATYCPSFRYRIHDYCSHMYEVSCAGFS